MLDPTTPLDNRAAQYEEGTRVSVCITALEQSLDLMQELGIHNIAAQIKHTTDLLVAGLIERGATIRSQRDGEHWSGIVAWTHPDRELHEVAAALQAAGVLVTIREGSLRAPLFQRCQRCCPFAGGAGWGSVKRDRESRIGESPFPAAMGGCPLSVVGDGAQSY